MSSTASISSKPEKPIGRWAASEPQEAPANTTKPLTASAPARDEPLRLPTNAIVEGTMVATPRTKPPSNRCHQHGGESGETYQQDSRVIKSELALQQWT